jgi:hypothetical protein
LNANDRAFERGTRQPSKTRRLFIMNRINQIRHLNVLYFGALHSALAGRFPNDSVAGAQKLGIQAVTLGLNARELWTIHQEAMFELAPAEGDPETIQRLTARATAFFHVTLNQVENSFTPLARSTFDPQAMAVTCLSAARRRSAPAPRADLTPAQPDGGCNGEAAW